MATVTTRSKKKSPSLFSRYLFRRLERDVLRHWVLCMSRTTVTKCLAGIVKQSVTTQTRAKFLKLTSMSWEEKSKVWVTLTVGVRYLPQESVGAWKRNQSLTVLLKATLRQQVSVFQKKKIQKFQFVNVIEITLKLSQTPRDDYSDVHEVNGKCIVVV